MSLDGTSMLQGPVHSQSKVQPDNLVAHDPKSHCTSKTKADTDSSLGLAPSPFLLLYGQDVYAWQVVDCNDAASKECHHAKHAANAFDTEKVALMHGIFQLLQTPPGESHPT